MEIFSLQNASTITELSTVSFIFRLKYITDMILRDHADRSTNNNFIHWNKLKQLLVFKQFSLCSFKKTKQCPLSINRSKDISRKQFKLWQPNKIGHKV